MNRLKSAVSALAEKLGLNKPLRDRAVRRMKARHASQKKAERQAAAARDSAEQIRRTYIWNSSKKARAKRKDRKALRLDAKAEKEKARAVSWRGRARKLTQRIEGIETDLKPAEAALAKYERSHGPHIAKSSGKAIGGTLTERALWVPRYIWGKCAGNHRPNYYSMTGGGFNVTHALLKRKQKAIGQVPYERSDCSVFVLEVIWALGLPDPGGEEFRAGYTGTLVRAQNGWKQVSESRMRAKGWGYVVYGGGTGHHTEWYCDGDGGDMTIGHGDSAVDPAVIDDFGDGDYRCFIYDPS